MCVFVRIVSISEYLHDIAILPRACLGHFGLHTAYVEPLSTFPLSTVIFSLF